MGLRSEIAERLLKSVIGEGGEKLTGEAAERAIREAMEREFREHGAKAVREALEEAQERLVRELGEDFTQTLLRESLERTSREARERILREAGEEGAERGTRETAQEAGETVTREASERVLREGGSQAAAEAIETAPKGVVRGLLGRQPTVGGILAWNVATTTVLVGTPIALAVIEVETGGALSQATVEGLFNTAQWAIENDIPHAESLLNTAAAAAVRVSEYANAGTKAMENTALMGILRSGQDEDGVPSDEAIATAKSTAIGAQFFHPISIAADIYFLERENDIRYADLPQAEQDRLLAEAYIDRLVQRADYRALSDDPVTEDDVKNFLIENRGLVQALPHDRAREALIAAIPALAEPVDPENPGILNEDDLHLPAAASDTDGSPDASAQATITLASFAGTATREQLSAMQGIASGDWRRATGQSLDQMFNQASGLVRSGVVTGPDNARDNEVAGGLLDGIGLGFISGFMSSNPIDQFNAYADLVQLASFLKNIPVIGQFFEGIEDWLQRKALDAIDEQVDRVVDNPRIAAAVERVGLDTRQATAAATGPDADIDSDPELAGITPPRLVS